VVDFLNNCAHLKVVILVGFGLGVVIFGASAGLAPSVFNFDKSGSYECGFDPFEDARSRFDVRFYLVALLFIIFDLEVAFFISPRGGHLSRRGGDHRGGFPGGVNFRFCV